MWDWLCPSYPLPLRVMMDEGFRFVTPLLAFEIGCNILGKSFFFSIPINTSKHQEIWSALSQIWCPPLMHHSQHCQKRLVLKCSGQLYSLKMSASARLKKISKSDCWHSKSEDAFSYSTVWSKAVKNKEKGWEGKEATKLGAAVHYYENCLMLFQEPSSPK